jgi:threonine dehydratase
MDVADIGITLEDIKEAQRRLDGIIVRTPCVESIPLSQRYNCKVFLKLENLQTTGSYKLRGAYNMMHCLAPYERQRGVITASAGNHAQGVAYAARAMGIARDTIIVMANGASEVKQDRTKSYGVSVLLHGETFDKAQEHAMFLSADNGKRFIPAFNHQDIIAGQGTVGLEILQEHPDTDLIIVPVGGGGLISGVTMAAHSIKPDIRLLGVEADGAQSFIYSLQQGERAKLPNSPDTIADGIAVAEPGEHTYRVVKEFVERQTLDLVAVPDDRIAESIAVLANDMHIISEAAGAAGIAALQNGQVERLYPQTKIVVVISGGNITKEAFARYHAQIATQPENEFPKYLEVYAAMPNTPGQLIKLLEPIAALEINVISVHFPRRPAGIGAVLLEIQNSEQDQKIEEALSQVNNGIRIINSKPIENII